MRYYLSLAPALILAIVCLGSLTACSVSVPSAEEQAQLVKEKNFPGGTPVWFANTKAGSQGYGGSSTGNGIIPTAVTPPPSVAEKVEQVEYPILVRAEETAKQADAPKVEEAKSALDRIEMQCPGSEADVNAALTNLDREKKIAQYETLTRKCPMSADLQLWLSQEYLKANKLAAARAGFGQVLVLDPTNEEAKAGIAKVETLSREK